MIHTSEGTASAKMNLNLGTLITPEIWLDLLPDWMNLPVALGRKYPINEMSSVE